MTMRSTLTGIFKSPNKPDETRTSTSTSEGKFTLEWRAGRDGEPDTVALSFRDENGNYRGTNHFIRKL